MALLNIFLGRSSKVCLTCDHIEQCAIVDGRYRFTLFSGHRAKP